MTIQPPPIQQPILTGSDGKSVGGLNLLWALFFNQVYQGDAGADWVPQVANLTVVGNAPQYVGRVYKLSQYLTYFRAEIIPANGGNTSSVQAKTYIDNFPYVMSGNGVCMSVTEGYGGSLGMCSQATNKIWLPAWNTVNSAVTIIGLAEAS
ncbi:MAG: hypothetical protein KGL39_36955 [Patescibacteria group bacterium]|nr:hypothetical protein [Patescibacteria group bacterium]